MWYFNIRCILITERFCRFEERNGAPRWAVCSWGDFNPKSCNSQEPPKDYQETVLQTDKGSAPQLDQGNFSQPDQGGLPQSNRPCQRSKSDQGSLPRSTNTAFTLAEKSVSARHSTACFVSVNACFAVPCRVESCRADPLYKSELTWHGTTRHRFFWQCKRKRAKVGRAGVKKLPSGNFVDCVLSRKQCQ